MTTLSPADRPTAAEVAATIRGGIGDPGGVTRPMPAAGPTTTQVRPAVADVEASDPVGEKAQAALDRLRSAPREIKAALAAGAALLLFLVLIGLLAGSGSAPDLPSKTPPNLREPLSDLHRAVDGDG
jgi:hypothetical protein